MPVTADHVRVVAAMVGIAITPGQMPGVIGSLQTVLEQTALLFDPAIAVLIEPAPVFVP